MTAKMPPVPPENAPKKGAGSDTPPMPTPARPPIRATGTSASRVARATSSRTRPISYQQDR